MSVVTPPGPRLFERPPRPGSASANDSGRRASPSVVAQVLTVVYGAPSDREDATRCHVFLGELDIYVYVIYYESQLAGSLLFANKVSS